MSIEPLREGDPKLVGDFTVLARLNSGGFGDVFVAEETEVPRELVALKIWKEPIDVYPGDSMHFLAEVEATEKVTSEFMPGLISSGLLRRTFVDGSRKVIRDYPWMATRLIAGLSLHEAVKPYRKLPLKLVRHLGYGIATAIKDLHESGQLHRDLKPDNVLLALNGPWVIDLSLTYLMGAEHRHSSALMLGPGEFAAPEWWDHGLRACGPSADVFSLGAVLLFAATGHGPYGRFENMDYVDYKHKSRLPYLAGLREPLRDLIAECLAREPETRPSLSRLRLELSKQAGGAGRKAFPHVLPEGVVAMLGEHLRDLATVTKDWGPAKWGWGFVPGYPEGTGAGWFRGSGGTATANAVLGRPVPEARRRAEWSRRVSSWVRGPIGVHGGMVVTASLDGTVTVLRRDDGSTPAPWPGIVSTGAKLHSGPLILADGTTGGTAYVGDADGRVHGIDLATGQDRVILAADAAIEGTPVALAGSVPNADGSVDMVHWLYALSADGCVHSVYLRTGEPEVIYRFKAPVTGALAIGSDTLLVACADGYVHAIDTGTGLRKWPLFTGGQVLAAPVNHGEFFYICGTDGIVRTVEVRNGLEAGRDSVGGPVHCRPAVDESRLYVGSGDGAIHAYDVSRPHDGSMSLLWTKNVGQEVAGLAADDEKLYVAAGHLLVELDGETGEEGRGFASTDSLICGAPVISEQCCYVASLSGAVTCFSLD